MLNKNSNSARVSDNNHNFAEANETLYDKALFSWRAPEYLQHEKGALWYLIAGIVAAAFTLVAILQENWTLAIAILIFAVVYYYLQNYHPPKEIEIKISEIGIKIGHKIFPFSHIKAFWIHYDPPYVKTLNFRLDKGHYYHDVSIQMNEEDPVALREYLCTQVPEWEGKNEAFIDILMRLFRL